MIATIRQYRDLRRRAAHQPNTIYRRLLAKGFTHEEIVREASGRVGISGFRIFLSDNKFGESPIVGVTYECDARAEEEYGVGDLAKTFREIRGKRGKQAARVVITHLDGTATRLMPSTHSSLVHFVSSRAWDTERAIRQNAEKVNARLTSAYRSEGQLGEFRSGTVLTLAPETRLATTVLGMIVEAADASALQIGGGGSLFLSGLSIFDNRDIGPRQEEADTKVRAWTAHQMALKEPVEKLIRTRVDQYGNRGSFFFLGKPVERDGVVRYRLNYSPPRGEHRNQIMGSFTLEELEKIAAGDYAFLSRDDQVILSGRR